ncbi:MICOS complex subunit MIC13 QIL1 [Blattella germanica]|nr:MICOS complex subunit MIC13 QIL1 [Blattella germanica]
MLGTKVGLSGGVVYYPVEEGVRKDSEHSAEIYSKTAKAPYIKEVPVEVPELSKIPDLCYTTKNYCNKGVMTSFEFVLFLRHVYQ